MDGVIVKMEIAALDEGYEIFPTNSEDIASNGVDGDDSGSEEASDQLNSVYCFLCETCTKAFSETCHEEGHKCSPISFDPFSGGRDDFGSLVKTIANGPKSDLQPCLHNKEKTCTYCPNQCSKTSKLVKNWRTPEFGKPFSCINCSQSFPTKSELVLHERIHTNDSTLSCTYCPRVFSRKCSLEAHERSHMDAYDVKPFPCRYCEKSYKHKRSLSIHSDRVHGEDIKTL